MTAFVPTTRTPLFVDQVSQTFVEYFTVRQVDRAARGPERS